MKQSLKKLARMSWGEGVRLALLAALSCAPLQATDKAENGVISVAKKLSTLSLNNIDSLASKEVQDAFSWQNAKHYESVIKIFEDLADHELTTTIQRLIEVIGTEYEFFNRTFQYVISMEQRRITEWMKERVLTEENYEQELSWRQQQSNFNDDSSELSAKVGDGT